MAQITIIGGYGKVAMRLSRILAQHGHEVSSWIRSSAQSFYVREVGAKPLIVNVEPLLAATMAGFLRGEDAVVWSAGAGGGNPRRTDAVDRQAAIRAIDAAEMAGVKRFVMVSWFYDHDGGHGISPNVPFWHYAEAKADADAHLKASGLDWTILGPSTLTDEPGTGQISVGGAGSSVSRDDVAALAAEVLWRPETYHRVINFNSGKTPITDAIASL